MRRPLNFILAVILLITCSGCFWGYDHGRYGGGGHERVMRHDDHREHGDRDRGEHRDRDRREHEERY